MPVADGYYINREKYGSPGVGAVVYDPARDRSGDVITVHKEDPRSGYSATWGATILWDDAIEPETVRFDETPLLVLTPRPARGR